MASTSSEIQSPAKLPAYASVVASAIAASTTRCRERRSRPGTVRGSYRQRRSLASRAERRFARVGPWCTLGTSCGDERQHIAIRARVAELVDALDLGSSPLVGWGFESPLSHCSSRARGRATCQGRSDCVRIGGRHRRGLPDQEEARHRAPGRGGAGEDRAAYRGLVAARAIKGFRPGKVPRHVLERYYGSQVESEVIGELIAALVRARARGATAEGGRHARDRGRGRAAGRGAALLRDDRDQARRARRGLRRTRRSSGRRAGGRTKRRRACSSSAARQSFAQMVPVDGPRHASSRATRRRSPTRRASRARAAERGGAESRRRGRQRDVSRRRSRSSWSG